MARRISVAATGEFGADVLQRLAAQHDVAQLLTRLIGLRYWSAFHQERAAQSVFDVVMCCSGPAAAYRKELVDRVKDQYVTQVFLGRRCTFGDDRQRLFERDVSQETVEDAQQFAFEGGDDAWRGGGPACRPGAGADWARRSPAGPPRGG